MAPVAAAAVAVAAAAAAGSAAGVVVVGCCCRSETLRDKMGAAWENALRQLMLVGLLLLALFGKSSFY